MNFILILKDSFRIFRTMKLIWCFGFILLLTTTLLQFFSSIQGNLFFLCVSSLLNLAVWCFSVISSGGLTYLIYQTTLNKRPSFTEVWHQSQARFPRLLGASLFIILPVSTELLILYFFTLRAFASPILWLIILLLNAVFLSSLLTFSNCAIMIHDVGAVAAAWTSLLITLNNFFRVFVITGMAFFTQLLGMGLAAILFSVLFKFELPMPLALDYFTYQKIMAMPVVIVTGLIMNLFLIPFTLIILTLSYLKFTKEISYPELSKQQSAA